MSTFTARNLFLLPLMITIRGSRVFPVLFFVSVKQRSKEALLSAKQEQADREKVREDLQVVSAWMEAAGRLLLAEGEDSSTQVRLS